MTSSTSKFLLRQGTKGKLIELPPNANAIVKDWELRKDIVFESCLIDPIVVRTMVQQVQQSLAGALAKQGYALFGGDSGADRQARFVFAVKYTEIELL